ncbi:hypothetical protein M747DRAFT_242070 [Aspergillus niger ATCC 13496]|uniref:Contig An01c0170, genomic contig n=3 Tax=Aspergillus niger TaxID=5061 RepID=A2Q8M4_ASPNC|nr:uncharacterized protein An01g04870 [Aspergillus niger]RDH17955.1 hypothetical protein M747DRAFT_242070 [Aspergillus niger ATCC 13496]CAK37021.1 unnamed protein product [Aspergillus niger]
MVYFVSFFLLHFQPRQGRKARKSHGWMLRRLNLMAKAWPLSKTRQGLHEDVASSPKRSHKIESSLATWPKAETGKTQEFVQTEQSLCVLPIRFLLPFQPRRQLAVSPLDIRTGSIGPQKKYQCHKWKSVQRAMTAASIFLATVAPEELTQSGQCSAYHGSWWAPSHRLLSSHSPYLFLSVPSGRYTPEVFPDGSIGEPGADRQRGGGLPKEELRVVEMASDGVVRYGAVRRRRLGKCTVVKVIVARLVQKNLPFQTLFSFISFSLVGLSQAIDPSDPIASGATNQPIRHSLVPVSDPDVPRIGLRATRKWEAAAAPGHAASSWVLFLGWMRTTAHPRLQWPTDVPATRYSRCTLIRWHRSRINFFDSGSAVENEACYQLIRNAGNGIKKVWVVEKESFSLDLSDLKEDSKLESTTTTTTTIPRHGIKASAALERVHCSSAMVVVSVTGRVNTTYPTSRMRDGAFQICGRGSTRKVQVTLAEHIGGTEGILRCSHYRGIIASIPLKGFASAKTKRGEDGNFVIPSNGYWIDTVNPYISYRAEDGAQQLLCHTKPKEIIGAMPSRASGKDRGTHMVPEGEDINPDQRGHPITGFPANSCCVLYVPFNTFTTPSPLPSSQISTSIRYRATSWVSNHLLHTS